MYLDGRHVVSEYQPFGAAQLSIKIVDYNLNRSFHYHGSSSVTQFFDTTEERLKQLIIRTIHKVVMRVFDSFLVIEIHPQRDLEMGRVFFDGAGDDVSYEERR